MYVVYDKAYDELTPSYPFNSVEETMSWIEENVGCDIYGKYPDHVVYELIEHKGTDAPD